MHRSIGRVLNSFWKWGTVWSRVIEDTPALNQQPGLDVSIPTFIARHLRAYVQAHPNVSSSSLLCGAAIGDDDLHRDPEHRILGT